MRRALLLSLLLAAPARGFDATGEILMTGVGAGGSAAFDADRVIGPGVNLTRMEGGAWAGDLVGQSLALEVSDRRLSAPNLELFLEQQAAKGTTAIRGYAFGRRYDLELGPKGLSGRVGACSLDLKRTRTGLLAGKIGCATGAMPVVSSVTVKLTGRAGDQLPPLPQFALALVSIFY